MSKKSLYEITRKLAVKLGLKPLLLPIYNYIYGYIQSRKLAKLMKRYDPVSTIYGLNAEKRNYELTVSFTTYVSGEDRRGALRC